MKAESLSTFRLSAKELLPMIEFCLACKITRFPNPLVIRRRQFWLILASRPRDFRAARAPDSRTARHPSARTPAPIVLWLAAQEPASNSVRDGFVKHETREMRRDDAEFEKAFAAAGI